MIVKELNIPRLKVKVYWALGDSLPKDSDDFLLDLGERRCARQALRLKYVRAQSSRAEITVLETESRLSATRLFSFWDLTTAAIVENLIKKFHHIWTRCEYSVLEIRRACKATGSARLRSPRAQKPHLVVMIRMKPKFSRRLIGARIEIINRTAIIPNMPKDVPLPILGYRLINMQTDSQIRGHRIFGAHGLNR